MADCGGGMSADYTADLYLAQVLNGLIMRCDINVYMHSKILQSVVTSDLPKLQSAADSF